MQSYEKMMYLCIEPAFNCRLHKKIMQTESARLADISILSQRALNPS